jgi:hypothetical protein
VKLSQLTIGEIADFMPLSIWRNFSDQLPPDQMQQPETRMILRRIADVGGCDHWRQTSL